MAIVLPDELNKRYRGDDYIARMPFLLNSHLDAYGALDKLAARTVTSKDLFLGIPGFRSLDMLSVIGSDMGKGYKQAVLFDVNMTQIKAMNSVLHMISHSKTPDEFIEQFAGQYMKWIGSTPREHHPRQTDEDRSYFAVLGRSAQPESVEALRTQLEDEQINPYSWLFPRNFEKIKQMVENGDIATAVMDMKDDKRVELLRDWMQKQKLRTGDVYTSSSLLFMAPDRHFSYYSKVKTDDAQKYLGNLLSVTDAETRMLYSAPTPPSEHSEQGSNEFMVSIAKREAFERLLTEWNEEPPVAPLEKRYQYLFQAGKTGFQIGTCDSGDVPEHKTMMELIAENRDLRPDEIAKMRQELKMAGIELAEPRGIMDGNIRFYASEADLRRPSYFEEVATIIRGAMSAERYR